MIVASKHSRPDQWPSVRLAPLATVNSGTSRLASRPSQMDVRYLLNPEVTPESEHGSRFAGHLEVVCSPIAPSSQSSSPGATFGRTPLPDVAPAVLTGSTSSPDVPISGLDHLAMAASMRKPSPKHHMQAGSYSVPAKKVTRTYIEEVLTERGQSMTSHDIYKAIIVIPNVKLAPQSVRKELSRFTSSFEPLRDSTWALKSWGLSACRMSRRFGTGGGTKEARQRRAARK
ncbi:hypothetical protein VC83_00559 [Pseudogymnoascus destructans]|uniref:Uncharacterized protein n=1 Tax=Pseudogymnoascus destructans TaxID=655981 RepID=A0A177ANX2_9PEZI|nr:uncharacterized protein VC83_00559 [Pseudogymnoascus destructans]OAF63051.1 hypothetical protein VC83_00559 [Pseudogymnoascus destructans]